MSETSRAAANPFISKIRSYREFSEDEAEVLNQLVGEDVRAYVRGATLVEQGHPYRNTFILLDGWGMRYRDTHDGRRQIINFTLPGDLIALRACVSKTAVNSVSLLTDAQLALLTTDRIMSLFSSFPHLAAALFWYSGQEFELLVRQLSSLGTAPAAERTAHLFLQLWQRLEGVGLVKDRSFFCPLTQEHIAQCLGLSVVHVNRTLKFLMIKHKIRFSDHRVELPHNSELIGLVDATYLNKFSCDQVDAASGIHSANENG